MKRFFAALAAGIFGFCGAGALGQQPSQGVELPVVFDDSLAEAPYDRYKSLGPGESGWKAGAWTIKAPAGFVRPAKAGRDVQLAARLSFPHLAKADETSQTRLGLVYANNMVAVVNLVRKRDGEKITGQIEVLRQPDIVGPLGVALRKFEFKEDLPDGNWTIYARAGALTIACDGKELGRAALDTHTTPIVGMAVVQPIGSVVIQRLALRGIAYPADLSGQQLEQALAAATLNNQVGMLLQTKNFVEAMEKARRVAPMYRKVYGQDHHDVANALFNLGIVLKKGGESAEAVKSLEEALEVRQRLFGVDHPDTAQIEMELTVLLVDLKRLEAAFPHCMAAHFSFVSYYGDENRSTILSRQILEKLPRPKKEDET